MKKLIITAGLFASVAGLVGCGGAHGEDPGEAYMPDMYYSRAYETYGYNNVEGERDSLKNRGIFYNAMPVNGTIARGESMPYHYVSMSDSGRLAESNAIRNPLDSVTASKAMIKEAERLYLVNCGICHGTALDGNGPIYNNGNGPYPVMPKSLVAPDSKAFSDGHYFHVITFGKGAMGSYASQLTPEQRWWVIKYIRTKQGGGPATTGATDSTKTATTSATDTTKKG
jgi:mono/diheme cytochrome c family protein